MVTDSLDLKRMQQASDEAGARIPVRATVAEIASGEKSLDWDFVSEVIRGAAESVFSDFRKNFLLFLAPGILSAVCALLSEGKGGASAICAMACAACFLGVLKDAVADARGLFQTAKAVSDASLPVIASLSALSGHSAAAAMMTPSAALAGELIVKALGEWGVFLCASACALAAIGTLSEDFRPEGLFSLMKTCVSLGCGLMLALFVGILKVQGLLSSNFNSAAVKTAQFAFDKMVPVIGGRIADSIDVTLSSVRLVRSAVGVTGMCVLLKACAAPILRIWARGLAIRMAGALTQLMGGDRFVKQAERFSGVVRMLVTMCLSAFTIALILIGAAIRAGQTSL